MKEKIHAFLIGLGFSDIAIEDIRIQTGNNSEYTLPFLLIKFAEYIKETKTND